MINYHADKFCPAPWTSIYVNPDGRVDNCCVSTNNLGLLGDSSIGEIVTNQLSLDIRKKFSIDEYPGGCSTCDQSSDKMTLRSQFVKWFESAPKDIYNSPNNFELRYADLRWKNTCNFACVYCYPDLSSAWAQELGRYVKIEKDDNHAMLEYILKNLKTLNYLYLAGGEPFLLKENEIVLEELLKVNPDCEIRVNTNLSRLDSKTWQLARQFKNLHIIVSVEDTEERFDYIRYGGNWKQFDENIKEIRKFTNQVTFNMVYTALNTHSIFNCVDYLEDLRFNHEVFNFLYYNLGNGGSLEPRLLHANVLSESIKLLESRINSGKYFGHFLSSLNTVKNILQEPYKHNVHHTTLFQFLENIDKRRNLNSRTLFPEIYQYE